VLSETAAESYEAMTDSASKSIRCPGFALVDCHPVALLQVMETNVMDVFCCVDYVPIHGLLLE
jgi:hypothetical protein